MQRKISSLGPGNASGISPSVDKQSDNLDRKGRERMNHTQQRYYTPKSISQQLMDASLEQEHVMDIHSSQTDTSYTRDTSMAMHPISRDYNFAKRELLRRPLGGIEQMYNMYSSQGTDVICLMTKVETTYPVTPSAVVKALHLLHKRHPLLRMSIRQSKDCVDHLDFVENERVTCDFAVSNSSDWIKFMLEELKNPFDSKCQSLIRYRLFTSTVIKMKAESEKGTANERNTDSNYIESDFNYQARFLFIMHHSIMDGGYSLWIFQEFINFLDAVASGMDIHRVKELPLLPPFEDIFLFTCDTNQDENVENKQNSLTFCDNSTNETILQAYNNKFKHEIYTSPEQKLQNGCLVFKFSEARTRSLFHRIKSNKCTPKGAVIAASTLALLELVYGNDKVIMDKKHEIPIEYMADLRRVGDFQLPNNDVPHYPGMAALHIPLLASLQFDDTVQTTEIFWNIAKQFGKCLDTNIDSPEVYEWIKAEAAKYYKCPTQPERPGKSPYVISISNMGRLDGVLNTDVADRVRLVDLHGHSSILVDEMPLFCVTTFALNGHFCGNVSFCSNYTSYQTASKYVGLFQKYLCPFSNL